jgi:hypothetical protein
MQYFDKRGKAKKWGHFLARILDVFCLHCQTKNVNKSNQKKLLLMNAFWGSFEEFSVFIAFEKDGQTIELLVKQLSTSPY